MHICRLVYVYLALSLLWATLNAEGQDYVNSPCLGFDHEKSAFALGALGQFSTYETAKNIPIRAYGGPNPSAANMGKYKGIFVEELMDDFFTGSGRGSSGSTWVPGTGSIRQQGIDRIYFRVNSNGEFRGMLVGEAKYGSSIQGHPSDSPQMSQKWIKIRLVDTSRLYADIADDISSGGAVRASKPSILPKSAIKVPLKNSEYAIVWRDGNRLLFYSSNASVSGEKIANQAYRASGYCQQMASSDVHVRGRYFRYDFVGNQHRFQSLEADPVTGKQVYSSNSKPVQGSYENLPEDFQRMLKSRFYSLFKSMGMDDDIANAVSDKCCKDPAYFQKMGSRPQWSVRSGLDVSSVKVGAAGAGIAALFDIGSQLYATGSIDIRQVAAMGLLGFASGVAGNYSSAQIASFLCSTKVGLRLAGALPSVGNMSSSALLSSMGAGAVVSSVFAYGMYFMGYCTADAANRQALAGVAGSISGAAATAGFFGIASAFGTASSGTAIGSLSGAAFTNASLAWLGGGSVAAGGGGMAVGSAILTGGVTVLIIGVAVGVSYAFSLLDRAEQQQLVEGKLEIVSERVSQGIQPEWSS